MANAKKSHGSYVQNLCSVFLAGPILAFPKLHSHMAYDIPMKITNRQIWTFILFVTLLAVILTVLSQIPG
jgi:hypothetical protein